LFGEKTFWFQNTRVNEVAAETVVRCY